MRLDDGPGINLLTYDAIYASHRRWREGEHNIWAWIGYLVDFLVSAYDDFDTRVVARRNLAAGSKQGQVRLYVLDHAPAVFRLRDVRLALQGSAIQRSSWYWLI